MLVSPPRRRASVGVEAAEVEEAKVELDVEAEAEKAEESEESEEVEELEAVEAR